MKIPVNGFDPSLSNWGMARAMLDLETGILSDVKVWVEQTKPGTAKQVRQNSDDLIRTEALAKAALLAAGWAKVTFVEVPVGSQSARAMMSYGACLGVLGALRAQGHQIIEVNPSDVKKHFTGNKVATKEMMIDRAIELYPDAGWPMHRGQVTKSKCEHMADAIASIHAGGRTPEFSQLRRLLGVI